MRDKAAQVVDSDRVIVLANRDDVTAYRLFGAVDVLPGLRTKGITVARGGPDRNPRRRSPLREPGTRAAQLRSRQFFYSLLPPSPDRLRHCPVIRKIIGDGSPGCTTPASVLRARIIWASKPL